VTIMIKYIPFIVTGMILYDLSIHFVYLIKKEKYFLDRNLNWWPNFPKLKEKIDNIYQLFWNIYWGIAFLLMAVYLYL